MNRKHNTISFYCSWILPYILSKAILLDAHLEFYLIEETKQALFFFEKLDKKEKIDDEFVSDFSQFCIYVSNMRLTIQSSITITNELNQQGFDDAPMIFKSEDLILLDRLLQVLYDNYRKLVEFGTMDKSDNFFSSPKFFMSTSPLIAGPADIIKNDYEISVKFVNEE